MLKQRVNLKVFTIINFQKKIRTWKEKDHFSFELIVIDVKKKEDLLSGEIYPFKMTETLCVHYP